MYANLVPQDTYCLSFGPDIENNEGPRGNALLSEHLINCRLWLYIYHHWEYS